jgi:hypothetical protein
VQKHLGRLPLTTHSWPGNVRELQNFAERAVILSQDRVLHPPIEALFGTRHGTPIQDQQIRNRAGTLVEAEREHILLALRQADWVVGGPNGAAYRLGLKRTTLAAKMRKLGISRPSRRHDAELTQQAPHQLPSDNRLTQSQSNGAINSFFDSSWNGDTLGARPKSLTWALSTKRDEAMTSMA